MPESKELHEKFWLNKNINWKRGLYGKRSAACRRKELVCTSLADLIRIL